MGRSKISEGGGGRSLIPEQCGGGEKGEGSEAEPRRLKDNLLKIRRMRSRNEREHTSANQREKVGYFCASLSGGARDKEDDTEANGHTSTAVRGLMCVSWKLGEGKAGLDGDRGAAIWQALAIPRLSAPFLFILAPAFF